MALLVLSVVGSDRPGLTKALAATVLSAGGNWLESHLSRLGGLYLGSVLVELAEGKVDALRAAVAAVDAAGLEVRIAPAVEDAGAAGETLEFSLVGQDRPGIVNQAAHLRLPEGLKAAAVQDALEAISGEIMVDVAMGAKA